jgi:hypothetical protein
MTEMKSDACVLVTIVTASARLRRCGAEAAAERGLASSLRPETAEQESGPATIAVSAILGGVHLCQIVR